jgi:hypothetical protein
MGGEDEWVLPEAREGTYSDAICFDRIVSHRQNNTDYTPEFINNSPPRKMRKQIRGHIRCNRRSKGNDPANLQGPHQPTFKTERRSEMNEMKR